jgi:hypothetical protein
MPTTKTLAALALGTIGAFSLATPSHAAATDTDDFTIAVAGVTLSASMNWTHTRYEGQRVDLGEFSVRSLNVSGRCATITIDWFDGTPDSGGQAIAHMEQGPKCATVPTNDLNQLDMSRFNVPPALKARVCVVSTGVFPPTSTTRCVTTSAFSDNALTGL